MKIRLLNELDVQQYRYIRLESLKKHPESFGSSYEEEKDFSIRRYNDQIISSYVFGAFKNSELIGILTLKKEHLVKLRHRANITTMYVSPINRNQGVGKKLLTTCIEKIKILEDVEQIYLTVASTNHAAKNLYLSLGFKTFCKEKRALKINDIYIDEEHMVLFSK
ncbi:GNAT family N-acetyltransferase [Priestia megaterium]|uniref:GNAT family N-acetyltransferase n=1 Tax=Priestia megaterium TaxID=1404 RepID=UPI003879908B